MTIHENCELSRHGYTSCAECGTLIPIENAAKKTYYNDSSILQEEHFCSDTLKPEESCHIKWYMKRLRSGGL